MINTIHIKKAQLRDGYFKIGSGPENILIMGSCRVCPYVEWLNKWNDENGNRFTIYSLDPFNHNWDEKDERVDYDKALLNCESNVNLLKMLRSIDVFVHEYYQNAGMFNCNKSAEKNIYQFELEPTVDVCLPNWNDVFVLFGDIVTFDNAARTSAIQDMIVTGGLTTVTKGLILSIASNNLEKFYGICKKSDIPEMEEYFRDNLKRKRLFWTYNHTATPFNWFIFLRLCKRFLDIELTNLFIQQIYVMPDMFANNYTHLTEYDVEFYGFQWGEPIKPLRERL